MEGIQVIKGYELHDRIGSGGFGVVHRAYQTTVGREVAIKIILPHFANQPDFIRRFETEAQLVARLEHPHIVPLYDYWRDPGGAYLVMRWLRGGSLRDALQQGPFELETAAQLLDQVTAALALAHRNDVIHRDLKPANILLDEDGNAYLSDFGIAKDIRDTTGSQTGSDVILGSPDYLAPEQARSDPVNARTDIYSLGIVLFEMLTGQHPFPNKTSVERMYHHLNDPLPPITTLPDDLCDGVNAIIQKATAKNPAHRYADVVEIATDFRQATALSLTQAGESLVEQLTFREQEILQFIVEGCSNREIAQKLFVTVGTVKWHIWQLYRKLHVRSRVQAIARARELNLLIPDTTGELAATEATYAPLPPPENPYKGLRAFQAVDARDFFGREKLVQRLIARLAERNRFSRFLAVVGPSGSGKSSVVKAGLIPALWRGDLPGSDRWFVIEMMPGARPLDELEVALTRVAANQAEHLRTHLERDTHGLLRAAALILPDDGSELVVIIDQFEEIFTLVTNEDTRAHFLNLIHAGVTDPRSRVRVVVTLRADFYDRPLHYPEFGELVRTRMETVLPLSADELEAAVTKPVERVGVSFEAGLVTTITSETHYQPGALPLLQYALTELFEQREGRVLTHAAYHLLGGAVGALAKRAEDIFTEQDAAGRDAVRQMFLRLVTFDEAAEESKRRVPRSELLSVATDADIMDDVIDTYAAYRLLTLDHDPATRSPTVELAHEAILREWDRLRTWLDDNRYDIRQQRVLAAAVNEWITAGEDPSYLLHGTRLEQFAGWAAETGLALTQNEREFLEASIARQAHEEQIEQERQQRELKLARQSANRMRYLVMGLAVFLIVAVILTGFALDARASAEDEREKAEREAVTNRSLVLAKNAEQAYQRGETDLALAFALQAVDTESPPSEAVHTLRDVALGRGTRAVFHEHAGPVWAVAFSPDGRYAVSGSCDAYELDENGAETCIQGSLVLMDLDNNEAVYKRDSQTGFNAAAFSPDGQTALTGGDDGLMLLWDVQTGEILRQFEGHKGPIYAVAFRPSTSEDNIRTALSASADGSLMLWNVGTGETIRTFGPDDPATDAHEGHTARVNAAAFSPDGTQVVSASSDTTLILWDIDSGAIIHRMEGHGAPVMTVQFVPDGSLVVSGSEDYTIRQWDVSTGEEITPIDAPVGGQVYCMDVTPDSETILICVKDEIHFWNSAQWQEESWLADNRAEGDGDLLSLAVSADGKRVIGGTGNGTVRVWNLEETDEVRRFDTDGTPLGTVAISADGQLLLTGTHGYCGGILWDTETGTAVQHFESENGDGLWSMGAALFQTPDGPRAVVGCANWEGVEARTWLAVWNADTGEELYRLEGHEANIWHVAVSADGRTAISSSIHGMGSELMFWNLETGEQIRRSETEATIMGIDLSQDSRRALTCSSEDRASGPGIVLWDLETGTMIDHYAFEVPLTDVVFGPDESTAIAATGDARIVKVDLATHKIMWQAYPDNEAWVISRSPNGRYVLIRDVNIGTLSLWDATTGELIQQLGDHHGEPPNVVFSRDSQTIFSAGLDGSIIEWRIADLSVDNLHDWVRSNRYIRNFTCRERTQYRIEPLCK
jgi:WD40 repeat protein/DNA-binding CsgD family transcriptional regulator